MPYHTLALKAQEVLQHTQKVVEEQLPLPAEGYKGTTDDLDKVLGGEAATRSTVEGVCAD